MDHLFLDEVAICFGRFINQENGDDNNSYNEKLLSAKTFLVLFFILGSKIVFILAMHTVFNHMTNV